MAPSGGVCINYVIARTHAVVQRISLTRYFILFFFIMFLGKSRVFTSIKEMQGEWDVIYMLRTDGFCGGLNVNCTVQFHFH